MNNGGAAVKQAKISEEMITAIRMETFTEVKEGVTDYPILDFDSRRLELLQAGVQETLKHSEVKPAGGAAYKAVKRTMDIVISLVGIIVLFIPMCIMALIIFLDDKGNPFFSQTRITENGKPFKMYKLRSMCMDAEKKFAEVQKKNKCDGIAFKSDEDSRITRIGKFIRKTSIDEIPQLLNVLKGDMSIIGPRPPLPREVVLYTPEHMNRLLVKGGLSCVCQVEGRSDMEFDKWIETDIEYIKERSIVKDISLIFRTVFVVIRGRGAR